MAAAVARWAQLARVLDPILKAAFAPEPESEPPRQGLLSAVREDDAPAGAR